MFSLWQHLRWERTAGKESCEDISAEGRTEPWGWNQAFPDGIHSLWHTQSPQDAFWQWCFPWEVFVTGSGCWWLQTHEWGHGGTGSEPQQTRAEPQGRFLTAQFCVSWLCPTVSFSCLGCCSCHLPVPRCASATWAVSHPCPAHSCPSCCLAQLGPVSSAVGVLPTSRGNRGLLEWCAHPLGHFAMSTSAHSHSHTHWNVYSPPPSPQITSDPCCSHHQLLLQIGCCFKCENKCSRSYKTWMKAKAEFIKPCCIWAKSAKSSI